MTSSQQLKKHSLIDIVEGQQLPEFMCPPTTLGHDANKNPTPNHNKLYEAHRLLKPLANPLRTRQGKTTDQLALMQMFSCVGEWTNSVGQRGAALTCLGEPNNEEFLTLKNPTLCPDDRSWTCVANNSVQVKNNQQDLTQLAKAMHDNENGDPGMAFMGNMRKFGRMNGCKQDEQPNAAIVGCNPCYKLVLESYQMCKLAAACLSNHMNKQAFCASVKNAHRHLKLVAAVPSDCDETNEKQQSDTTIGLGMIGAFEWLEARATIARDPTAAPLSELAEWPNEAHQQAHELDQDFSATLGAPCGTKMTCMQPAGSTSAVANVSAGLQPPTAPCYEQ